MRLIKQSRIKTPILVQIICQLIAICKYIYNIYVYTYTYNWRSVTAKVTLGLLFQIVK